MPLIQANGTSLFYDETGPADAPVVVFSNSLGTTLEMWDAQVPALAGRWRVLRYDTRGHGRSPATGGSVTIETLADDLAGLLAALDIERAHVVGLSLGGIIAQALAIRHPRRVESLVLMATAPMLPPPENWEARANIVREKGMGAIADAVLARWFTPATAADPTPPVQDCKRRFRLIDANGYADCCLAIRDADLRAGLASIRVPTLVVAGSDDPVTTVEMGEDLARAIAGAGFEVVAERGPSHRRGAARGHQCAAGGFSRRAGGCPSRRHFGLRSRACEPQGQSGRRARAAFDAERRAVRDAVAGLHHSRRVGRDVG